MASLSQPRGRLFRKHVLLFVTLVSGALLAVTASAECAWVLWHHIEWSGVTLSKDARSTWDLLDGFVDRTSCKKAQMAMEEKVGRVERHRFPSGEEGEAHVHVLCLPDTVDPHGPKGK